MSVTKLMNSKANIKQYSGADYPVNPRQPVIARMAPVDSTANQTIINLPWTVDTVNAQDAFFLSIDGKILSIGALNDYTMTSIDALGFSSQVTLTVPLVAGLNIQAWKLGNKKESEFAQDQRFVSLYDAMDKSFQGFVDQSTLMTPTAVAGTPAAGTFYSTIVNRASMIDLRQDLKPRMGVERLIVQSASIIANEFGPNGEIVQGLTNDTFGQVRFVGSWATTTASIYGPIVGSAGTVGDFIEITFYGTGLNVLTSANSAYDLRASVDGGGEGANIFSTLTSNAFANRNYVSNNAYNVASNLTLGVHTVKLRVAASTPVVTGFDILNESSSVRTNPGVVYNKGQKIVTAAQDVTAYNSVVTGTRGGRVVVYQNADGSIGRSFQAVNATQANLTGADHTNEELVRRINFKEFGAGRSDDFSANGSGNISRTFTLDDGTTSLQLSGTNVIVTNDYVGVDGAGALMIFTFVGTGLDVVRGSLGGTTGAFAISVDNTNIGSPSTTQVANQRQTIVSGLPYGTHTVVFASSTGGAVYVSVKDFLVYQPKKPSIPSSAIELADYNVMADFSANTTAGIEKISQGVLRKASVREFAYTNGSGGTIDWGLGSIVIASQIGGWQPITDRPNAYYEFVFFGTGFELRYQAAGNRSSNMPITINGLAATAANYPTLVSSTLAGSSFSGGLLSPNTSTTTGSGVSIRNLPLARYTIRVTNPSTGLLPIEAIDIITPIHSAKLNTPVISQNTLSIGSQGISDNRKTSAIKELNGSTKVWAQAQGVTTTPSTSSTSFVPMPDMALSVKTGNGGLKISYFVALNFAGAATQNGSIGIYFDGVLIQTKIIQAATAGVSFVATDSVIVPVSAGVHKVDLMWGTNGAYSVTAVATQRTLIVEEK